MRISDWSSDVCSSDLERSVERVEMRKHQLGKHQHRGDGIDAEIEEFRRPADDDPDRDLGRRDLVAVLLERTGVAPGLLLGRGFDRHCSSAPAAGTIEPGRGSRKQGPRPPTRPPPPQDKQPRDWTTTPTYK